MQSAKYKVQDSKRVLRSEFCALHSAFRGRNARGSAMIETALVLPLYMLVLLGVIYFGYATLSKQRQVTAGALAAWLPGMQGADTMMEEFWPWEGSASGSTGGQSSSAQAGDTTIVMTERNRSGDEYYGNEIESQLTSGAHSIGGGGTDFFDTERIAVSLWTYALGEVTQSFNWVPGQGVVEQMNMHFDDFARYLNADSTAGIRMGGGFIQAGEGSPPSLFYNTATDFGPTYPEAIAEAFTGNGWLERRSATISVEYKPPFFSRIISAEGAPPPTFNEYITGDYGETAVDPTTSGEYDVTGRGESRRAALEDGDSPSEVINVALNLFNTGSLSDPDDWDSVQIGNSTMEERWVSK